MATGRDPANPAEILRIAESGNEGITDETDTEIASHGAVMLCARAVPAALTRETADLLVRRAARSTF